MVRLPRWGGNGMSITSKLTTLAAAGGGADAGFILEVDPYESGGTLFKTFTIDSSGNAFLAGHTDSSDRYAFICKANTDGEVFFGRYLAESPASGSYYSFANVEFTPSENYILGGLTMYSSSAGERVAACKINPSTLEYTDLEGYDNLIIGYQNTNGRAGRGLICKPLTDVDRWLVTDGWTGSNVGNYIFKYNDAGSYYIFCNNFTSYSTQYSRSFIRDNNGSYLYAGILTAPDPGAGGYGHMIRKFDYNGDPVRQSHAYSSSGGAYGPMQTQIGDAHGALAQDSTYIYSVGHHHNNTNPDGMYVQKVRKSDLSLIWNHMINLRVGSTNQYSSGTCLTVDDSGNVYAVFNNGNPDSDLAKIVKYNSSGSLQWVKGIGRATVGESTTINEIQVYDGSLYAIGNTSNGVETVGFFAKISFDGPSAGTYGNYRVVDYTNYVEDLTTLPTYSTSSFSVSGTDLNQNDRSMQQFNDSPTATLTPL